MFTFVYSGVDVDWRHGADYMLQRHGVRMDEAAEALADPDAVLFSPDPKSRSGSSARLLGFCASRGLVLVVILVAREDKLGVWWGCEWVGGNEGRPR